MDEIIGKKKLYIYTFAAKNIFLKKFLAVLYNFCRNGLIQSFHMDMYVNIKSKKRFYPKINHSAKT